MVIVYTLPACVQCDSTKRFLKTKFVEFEEIDMSQNQEALDKVKDWGYTQAPVVHSGTEHWSGFRFDKLATLAA
jgi:glutaredoxin-like protein NrdH